MTDKGNQEVKFCINEGETFHNFKTYLEKGMDVMPYLKPDQTVVVDIEGAKEESWDWQGKTYSDLLVHLSMIRKAGKTEAEDIGFPKEEKEPPPQEDTQEMWKNKEHRDYRGRCLVYAVETYKMSGEAKNLPIKDIQEKIETLADTYLTYIYKGK